MNPYDVLEVSPNASQKEVKQAYHRLARRWHPDTNNGEASRYAAEQMLQINEAWQLIGTIESRTRFDVSQSQIPEDIQIDRSHYSAAAQQNVRAQAQAEADTQRRTMLSLGPFVLGIFLLAGVVISSVLLSSQDAEPTPESSVNLGREIQLGDCVSVMQGPSLIEVPCTENAAGVVIGAREAGDSRECVTGTLTSVRLANGVLSCLR